MVHGYGLLRHWTAPFTAIAFGIRLHVLFHLVALK